MKDYDQARWEVAVASFERWKRFWMEANFAETKSFCWNSMLRIQQQYPKYLKMPE